jgi:hypothetical protein
MAVSDDSPRATSTTAETVKTPKPTRVHKREMELRGLMAFIPLLDANDITSTKRKKAQVKAKEARSEAAASSSQRESSKSAASNVVPGNTEEKQETSFVSEPDSIATSEGDSGASPQKKKKSTAELKGKRAGTRKSSLRRGASTKTVYRKRVSLVIDDQIVHPSDSLKITSPLSDSTAHASSSSVEDVRETSHFDEPGLVHHSLPSTSKTPSTLLSTSPPQLQFEPPQVATETFLEHDEQNPRSPEEQALDIYAGEIPAPISTYVGGLSGSGVDDVDQAGSYGYPSSLGASYMESYMASRPLSVRIAAVEKAELEDEEAKKLVRSEERADVAIGGVEEMDIDDGFLGEMENI